MMMTMKTDADRLRSHLTRLWLSQRGLARALGLGERTVRRYCAGQQEVPQVVWVAIEGLHARPPEKRDP